MVPRDAQITETCRDAGLLDAAESFLERWHRHKDDPHATFDQLPPCRHQTGEHFQMNIYSGHYRSNSGCFSWSFSCCAARVSLC
jgi:hypothetical protein